MIPKTPGPSRGNDKHKLDTLSSYPHKALILDFENADTSTVELIPLPNRFQTDDYVVWIDNVVYENILGDSNTVLDLTTTGLDGLVDGITFTAAQGRGFLFWAFANDDNNGFEGFGITHKPYSAYTGPASIAQGAQVTLTGMTNAYQFTVGARIAIRNSSGGVGLLFEYNWATIDSIDSTSTMTITTDNSSNYGVPMTNATGADVQQWDKFRPWVVASSSQTLYKEHYRLLGEATTNTSGEFRTSDRVDSPWRHFADLNYYNSTTQVTSGAPVAIAFSRWIPLWAKIVKVKILAQESSVTANPATAKTLKMAHSFEIYCQRNFFRVVGSDQIPLYSNARITVFWNSANITIHEQDLSAYYVPGGMRE